MTSYEIIEDATVLSYKTLLENARGEENIHMKLEDSWFHALHVTR